MRPTAADIVIAIAKAELGDWIDPTVVPINWFCDLYGPDGERAGDGNGPTPAEAMALAWVCAHAPDALVTGHVAPGEVPYEVAAGWRFVLTPPWRSK